MTVLAVDPGTTSSQYVVYDGARVLDLGFLENAELLEALPAIAFQHSCTTVVFEQIAAMGMIVGAEVFETCVWTGRFMERMERHLFTVHRIKRNAVKLHICQSPRAKDANIRQALLDRFGGKQAAIGCKATPGPLYRVKSHAWAALALAVTFVETHQKKTAA